MSKRLENFYKLREHLVIGKCFNHLSKKEIEMCEEFIRQHDNLDRNGFAFQVNRWMLDVPKEKRPSDRKYSAMWALVSQANS